MVLTSSVEFLNVTIPLTDIKQSIENYIKLTNNLSYNNLIDVKMIDLRDTQKAVIEYK